MVNIHPMPFVLMINYNLDKQEHTAYLLRLFDGPYHILEYLRARTKGLWTWVD